MLRSNSSQSFRYLISGSLIAAAILYYFFFHSSYFVPEYAKYHDLPDEVEADEVLPPYEARPTIEIHAIDHLIRLGQKKQAALLAKQTFDVKSAAAAYRKRRGRHPPPGFDIWVLEALKRNATLVEDFFDRVHHDIAPFWALEPRDIRVQANSYLQTVRVRKGNATFDTDDVGRVPWIQLWHNVIKEAAPHLPDVDMPINYMDETRILVPFDTMNDYIAVEQSKRKIVPVESVITSFPENGLKELDALRRPPVGPIWVKDEAPIYWEHYRNSCPPDTPSKEKAAIADFSTPVNFPTGWPAFSYHGYVQNFTKARDPCYQPHLAGMHGTFVESISMATTHELIPLFGGSKLPMNNEILLPPAMYLSDEARYIGGNHNAFHWVEKKSKAVWRGVASGGRNRDYDWYRFQRHRLVQFLNGTFVSHIEKEFKNHTAESFQLPLEGLYDIAAQPKKALGEWVGEWADAAFVHLECYPAIPADQGDTRRCEYTSPHFNVSEPMSMDEQFTYKFLPDVDGNSYSGRFRGFLLSSSLPIKATIYSEWHDDRLMPWVHYVPMDNTYQDLYGIMEYFLKGHDMVAQRIATEGRVWAEKVLRKEDMLLYIWRVLLEFARVCDDDRDRLGFVGDLVKVNKGL